MHDIVIFIVYSTEIARAYTNFYGSREYYMVIDMLRKTTKKETQAHRRHTHTYSLNKTKQTKIKNKMMMS